MKKTGKASKAEINKMITNWIVGTIQSGNTTIILLPCKRKCLCLYPDTETATAGTGMYPIEDHDTVLNQLMEMSRSEWADLPDNPQTVYIQLIPERIKVSVTFLVITHGKMVVMRIEK